MPKIIHFDIAADQPERAVQFYKKVFGWKIEKWEGPTDYWLIQTGEAIEQGIHGGLGKREDPSQSVTSYISVSSVDDYLAKIVSNGGKIILPKTPIPGIGYIATFKDTEGNLLGIMQQDIAAMI